MADDPTLPVIGPATAKFTFPLQDPDSVLKGLRGEDRLFAQSELAVLRCDFATLRVLYGKLSRSPKYCMAASRFGVIAAIGLGDLEMFDEIVRGLSILRRTANDSLAPIMVDIVESWLHQWLWIPTGYPEWLCRFDFENVPEAWRNAAAYLGIKIRLMRGQFESAYSTAALMMNYVSSSANITVWDSYLSSTRAIACRETGRHKEMMKWLDEVVRTLAPHGMFLPYLLVMHGSAKSPVEELLENIGPGLVSRYRELSKTYFKNMIRVRNHYLGEHVSDRLSFREMYLSMLLKRGVSYGDLATRFGITSGRLKNVVSKVYEKLGIHCRGELKDLVW